MVTAFNRCTLPKFRNGLYTPRLVCCVITLMGLWFRPFSVHGTVSQFISIRITICTLSLSLCSSSEKRCFFFGVFICCILQYSIESYQKWAESIKTLQKTYCLDLMWLVQNECITGIGTNTPNYPSFIPNFKIYKNKLNKKKIEKNASRMQSNAIFGLYIAAWLAL